ncbi:MAG: GNAT family N-acetyltransferase [Blastochloris viridis]|uniref:GNAT family N-acetyltransferase n=1 Tax=Blastochloris viridis TaxID=1079 RepID=A0A6N4RE23_BLAVI|nr:MAG: GNAT family N-acetyltransferase [Blastochloris viridis]
MAIVLAATLPENWSDPVLTRAQAEALLATPHHYLLITDQPYAAGYSLIQAMPLAQADILTLYVAPEHRRKHFGSALVQAALEMARSKQCEGLTLEVDATNVAAIKLYETHGLQKIGKRGGYYRDPVSKTQGDALVMAVSLA